MITEQTMVAKVRQLLGEASEDSGVSLITDDTLLLDKQIRSLLPEAVLLVQMNKTRGVVNVKSTTSCNIVADHETGKAVVTLPPDYVRLVSLKLTEWNTACTTAHPIGSLAQSMQNRKYMRAGKSSPVCIEGVDELNNHQLTLYPVVGNGSTAIEHLIYEARYNAGEGISGGDQALENAVTYQCAALLCSVYEKIEAANTFQSFAAALCKNNK